MIKAGRRGVLMTASATRQRGAWRVEEEEEVDVEKLDQEGGSDRQASQLEWEALEREVQEERKKLRAAEDLASGRRGDVVGYDDVAGEEEKDSQPSPDGTDDEEESDDDKQDAAAQQVPVKSTEDPGQVLPPEGVTTAGAEARTKKRGGQKSKKKKNAAGEQDGEPPKKKEKKEEDPDRWLKLQLEGEKKPKRIDATRVVHYHDFDGGGSRGAASSARPPALQADGGAGNSDFRSTLRMDLFDDDDEE